MTSQFPSPAPEERISDEAAHWCMRVHEDDFSSEERVQFEQWLKLDPAHQREFDAMQEIWNISDFLPTPAQVPPAPQAAQIIELQPKAKPIEAAQQQTTTRRPQRKRSWATAAAIALAIPLAGVIGWNQGWLPNSYQRYASDNAVQEVTLADGSQVQMNIGTRLSYSNYKDVRSVTLSQGEAFFKVHHDSEHPFVVNVGKGQVEVTGTQFNVWTYQDSVIVTLAEGSVKVMNDKRHPDRTAYLSPGMQARYSPKSFDPQVTAASLDSALAWRNGKLVLDNLSLADALPLINRYLESPIRIADPATAQLRIGGMYNTNDINGLVQALPKVLPVVLSRNAEGETVIKRRQGQY